MAPLDAADAGPRRSRTVRLVLTAAVSAALLGVLFALAVAGPTAPPSATSTASPRATTSTSTAASPPASTPGAGASPRTSETSPAASDGVALSLDPATAAPNPPALARFYDQKVTWEPCGRDGAIECASLEVPVDHAKPVGEVVRIAMSRRPAGEPDERKGTLFLNPGGPGSSGLELVDVVDQIFASEILEAYDVVGFDTRGTGESGGFDCMTDAELDAMFASDRTPSTEAQLKAEQDRARERLLTCVQRGGQLALHMGSEAVAADLDIMRAAVGDEHLNYMGVSYGTMYGAMYTSMFPTRVGHLVLDSAVYAGELDDAGITQRDVDDDRLDYERSMNGQLQDFLEVCHDHLPTSCPVSDSVAEAKQQLADLTDRLERTPVTDETSGISFGGGWFSVALVENLRDQSSYEWFSEALADLMKDGDAFTMASMASGAVDRFDDGTYPQASYDRNHLPITCQDWPATEVDTMTPSLSVLGKDVLWSRVLPAVTGSCAGWPGPVRAQRSLRSEPTTPTLILGNTDDNFTPIEDTRWMADHIAESRLVVADEEGHGAYANGNACVDDIVRDYLVSDTAPEASETYCESD